MKSDATEEARITKNESAFPLMQDKVIMFFRAEAGRFDAQLPGHAEVDADPIAAGEFEKHLFSPGFRAEKARTG